MSSPIDCQYSMKSARSPKRRGTWATKADKLLLAGFIREVRYTTWLANVVMVTKPNGNWRMCVDYINIKSACPKYTYPLPNIDRLVDGTANHKIMSFLDAYSGYNQISMHPRKKEKTL